MPKIETVEKFIDAVESTSHDLVIEHFYTDEASIQENQSAPRVGKKNLVENETRMLARVKSVTSKCVRPCFVKDNIVMIRWHFKFEWKDGTFSEIEEIAYQEWLGEYIQKEKFFYDPSQFIPKGP